MRLRLAWVLALMVGCGDKDGGDDTAGDTASDSAADTDADTDVGTDADTDADTDGDALGELGPAPASGQIVAEYTVGGQSDTLVCTGGPFGQSTDDIFVFNSLNHGADCTSSSAGFVALNNIPMASSAAWPGGAADVQVEVGDVSNRVYGQDITAFRVDLDSYDSASHHVVATVQARWADARLDVWIDADFN